VNIFPRLQSCI